MRPFFKHQSTDTLLWGILPFKTNLFESAWERKGENLIPEAKFPDAIIEEAQKKNKYCFIYKQPLQLSVCCYAGLKLIDTPASVNKANEAKMLGKTYLTNLKETLNTKPRRIMNTLNIKKILVPTDFSETGLLAMEHAIHLAELTKAHLYVMHVIEAFEYAYSIYDPDMNVNDSKELHETITQKLERTSRDIGKAHTVNISTLVGNGRPAMSIAQTAKDNEIDLIIMGTHGSNGFEEYFIGSNAHKVVTLAQCPVITVQEHAKKLGFANIVMPIDNSLHSRQKVDYVIKLASIYGSKVHVLGLLNSNEETDEKKFNIKLESAENTLKSAKIPYIRKVVKGNNIAVEAMKYSNEVNADLIVIMTDHESNITGMFLGALSKQIVNHSKIPVMSIKPYGFTGGYNAFGS
jgi:nucleotide-binding universal stress UspA family protein